MRHGLRFFPKAMRALQYAVLLGLISIALNAHSASKTLLVLGDSLSAEYGLAHGTGWVPLLERRLHQEKYDVAVVNASISGETTSGGNARLAGLLEKYQPSIVILELGANDGLRGLSLRSAEANLRSMITASQKAGAKVLLLGMQIPPNYGTDYRKNFAAMYPRLQKETRVSLVPFFLAPIAANPALFQSDRLHPTAEAQPLLFDTVWPYLKPLLKSGR